jgi:hypothetical protein
LICHKFAGRLDRGITLKFLRGAALEELGLVTGGEVGMRVLFVDDSCAVRVAFSARLKAMGHDVVPPPMAPRRWPLP